MTTLPGICRGNELAGRVALVTGAARGRALRKLATCSARAGRNLLRFGLILALACAATPALSKVVVKKGVYGAIALERESGQFGYAYNSATSRAAKVEALKQCAGPRCEIVASFSNACGVLVRGAKNYFAATGATRPEAETKARRQCAVKDCEVVAWACTK